MTFLTSKKRRYRSRTEIVGQILQAVSDCNSSSSSRGGGISKTKIMYKTFLSYSQLKEYLLLLTGSGMLQYDETTQTYRVTEKGHKFLKIYNEIADSTLWL